MPNTQIGEPADEIAHLLVRVYEIHEIIVAETGGLRGLREAGLLHSAIARPFATFGGVARNSILRTLKKLEHCSIR